MTGYRVKQCAPYIKEDRFMLTYGDAVSNVDIGKLVEFNRQMDTIGTVTGVYPPSRFGDLITDDNMVTLFKQQLKDIEHQNPINGGYFVFKREFMDLIPDEPSVDLEKLPFERIVEKQQLSVFKHSDFWQCMDTYRDNQLLNKMWIENPVWKVWK
jgi:glucose-1-phosphate cytidylyltransferase